MNRLERDNIDITLLLEGTYPYVSGGVSGWVHQLIKSHPQYRFAGIFLGGVKEDYKSICYDLPENFIYLDTHYLFEQTNQQSLKKIKLSNKTARTFKTLYDNIIDASVVEEISNDLVVKILNLIISNPDLSYENIIHSQQLWDEWCELYLKNCPEISFVDFFWSMRNIHAPIWKILEIVPSVPKSKIFHSISTGYAGLLGALLKYHQDKPYFVSEHGIYTKERKIDLLHMQWESVSDESDYRKEITSQFLFNIWIKLFENLAKICYQAANPIVSLFSIYRDRQVQDGANFERTLIIPNGVKVQSDPNVKNQLNQSAPVVGLIGRVVPIKDIKTFIRAIALVVKEVPNVVAWIMGSENENSEYATECKELVHVLKLDDNIHFLGVQNVEQIITKIDLVVISSISEGMPLAVLEAFSSGIPVVATNVGSCAELVYGKGEEDQALGSAGAIVNIANASAMAAEIITLVTKSDVWLNAHNVARKRLSNYYNLSLMENKYTKIYQELIQ